MDHRYRFSAKTIPIYKIVNTEITETKCLPYPGALVTRKTMAEAPVPTPQRHTTALLFTVEFYTIIYI